jgi:hypothetical protein
MEKPLIGSAFRPVVSRPPPPVWLLVLAVPFWLTVWYANRPTVPVRHVPRPVVESRCFEYGPPVPQRYYNRYNRTYRLGDFPTRPHWMLVEQQAAKRYAY